LSYGDARRKPLERLHLRHRCRSNGLASSPTFYRKSPETPWILHHVGVHFALCVWPEIVQDGVCAGPSR